MENFKIFWKYKNAKSHNKYELNVSSYFVKKINEFTYKSKNIIYNDKSYLIFLRSDVNRWKYNNKD